MVNKIIILLFVCAGLNAQYTARDNGRTVRHEGQTVKSVGVPVYPAPVSNYTIYKLIDWGQMSAVNDTMTQADVLTAYGGGAGIGTYPPSDDDDSVKIVVTASGNDTVRSVWIIPGQDKGAQIYGDFNMNGVDNTDDTSTVMNIEMWKFYAPNWSPYAGSKTGGGMGGKNRSYQGVGYLDPVAGGIFGPTCVDSVPYYNDEVGFNVRPATQNGDGIYVYSHNMWFSSSCVKDYGQHYHSGDQPEYGVWFRTRTRIILNSVTSPGNPVADGVVEQYRNDTLIAQETGIIFRYYDDVYIDDIQNSVLSRADAGRTEDTYIMSDDETYYIEEDWADAIESRTVGLVYPNSPKLGSEH